MTITFDKDGLVPAIIQDEDTNQVLTLGFMNRESLDRTLDSGHVTFWSRSRQELWEKGATSGNYLNTVSVSYNCEENSLLVKAHPQGPTCHTLNDTCYFRELDPAKDLD